MKTIISLASLLLLPLAGLAQVDVRQPSAVRHGQSVDVAFSIDSTAHTIKNSHKLVLTPFLYEGTDTAWLPPVEMYGRIRYKRERQEQVLSGNPDWTLSASQFREGQSFAYSATVPYRRWMRNASLGLQRRMVGCACDCYDGQQTLLSRHPIYVPPTPHVSQVAEQPAKFEVVDAHKRWAFDRDIIKVFFPVSRTVLHPDRYNNQESLDRIIEGLQQIRDKEKLRLNGVEITGFASPEGTLAFNTQLGKGRADALEAYIVQRMPELKGSHFNLINGAENWEGLRSMVAASDMPGRQEVLDIIDSNLGDGRKQALRTLAGGTPYAYMLEHFFPELRSACYIAVYYDVLGDKAADAVNAANRQIEAGHYREALQQLMPFKDDDRAWNSIGVCHMMLEDEEAATLWFTKAAEAGNQQARRNLQQIR